MAAHLDLPPGLAARPLTLPEAPAVAALIAAEERADLGSSTVVAADVAGFWERPSFDLAASTIGVFAGDRLVAYAEIVDEVWGAAAVDPEFRHRGLGTALAGWLRAVATVRGMQQLGTHVAQDSPADRLLQRLGYREAYQAWDLALPSRHALVAAMPPPGYALRAAREDELEACWAVIEDAFLEWADRERRPLEDWMAVATGRHDFEPWKLRVATDPSGAIVAVARINTSGTTALIDQLATRADQRGRGLASALITDAVVTSAAHGATTWTISTDARSGARSLYERVGMRVTSTWIHRVTAIN